MQKQVLIIKSWKQVIFFVDPVCKIIYPEIVFSVDVLIANFRYRTRREDDRPMIT